MTMSSMDKDEIIKNLSEQLRVRCEHRSISLSGEEVQEVQNFLDNLLSNHVDNKHYNTED